MKKTVVLAKYIYSCGAVLRVLLEDGKIEVKDEIGLDPMCHAVGSRVNWRKTSCADDETVPDYMELGMMYQLGLAYVGA